MNGPGRGGANKSATARASGRLGRLALPWACLLALLPLAAGADLSHRPRPPAAEAYVGIVIDDLGYRLQDGARALRLPGAVTYSFLPHTPHAKRLAEMAHARGSEVLLHLPMESVEGRPLGPGGLTHGMDRAQITRTVNDGLSDIPYVRGVSNHMGSLLTREAAPMRWLMQALKANGKLYFLDSRTSGASVAARTASETGLPVLSRDVFLDHDRAPEAIAEQVRRMVKLARKQGSALAVGHPYRETLEVLEALIPRLREQGIRLVRASQLMQLKRREPLWRLSLSHSLKGAKNSKPSPSSTCCAEPESAL